MSIKFDNVTRAKMASKFAKKCPARSGFFSVYQSNLLHAFFIFTIPSPSSWLFELPSSVTMQNNHWYATISLKADDLMGKGRRKRRPQLLANREARIWKQLNLLSWMLAAILNTAVHLPSRILLVNLSSAFRFPTSFAYMQSLIQNCSTGRKPVIFLGYITNQQLL